MCVCVCACVCCVRACVCACVCLCVCVCVYVHTYIHIGISTCVTWLIHKYNMTRTFHSIGLSLAKQVSGTRSSVCWLFVKYDHVPVTHLCAEWVVWVELQKSPGDHRRTFGSVVLWLGLPVWSTGKSSHSQRGSPASPTHHWTYLAPMYRLVGSPLRWRSSRNRSGCLSGEGRNSHYQDKPERLSQCVSVWCNVMQVS